MRGWADASRDPHQLSPERDQPADQLADPRDDLLLELAGDGAMTAWQSQLALRRVKR